MKPILPNLVLLTSCWLVAPASVLAADEPVARSPSSRTIEQFEKLATQWEAHCQTHINSSDHDVLLDTPAYKELQKLGSSTLPLIFKRWKAEEEKGKIGPPWQYLLRDLTKQAVITQDDRLAVLPAKLRKSFETGVLNIEGVELPELERSRWFRWWENEGRKAIEK